MLTFNARNLLLAELEMPQHRDRSLNYRLALLCPANSIMYFFVPIYHCPSCVLSNIIITCTGVQLAWRMKSCDWKKFSDLSFAKVIGVQLSGRWAPSAARQSLGLFATMLGKSQFKGLLHWQ